MESIYHITTSAAWAAALGAGAYTHESLTTEGFIHLSTRAELLATTERHYRGARDLILLEVDPTRIPDSRLVWEFAPAVGREFPHIYGPIPTDAVVRTHVWDPDDKGNRSLPPSSHHGDSSASR